MSASDPCLIGLDAQARWLPQNLLKPTREKLERPVLSEVHGTYRMFYSLWHLALQCEVLVSKGCPFMIPTEELAFPGVMDDDANVTNLTTQPETAEMSGVGKGSMSQTDTAGERPIAPLSS